MVIYFSIYLGMTVPKKKQWYSHAQQCSTRPQAWACCMDSPQRSKRTGKVRCIKTIWPYKARSATYWGLAEPTTQWIGSRENLHRKPWIFTWNMEIPVDFTLNQSESHSELHGIVIGPRWTVQKLPGPLYRIAERYLYHST